MDHDQSRLHPKTRVIILILKYQSDYLFTYKEYFRSSLCPYKLSFLLNSVYRVFAFSDLYLPFGNSSLATSLFPIPCSSFHLHHRDKCKHSVYCVSMLLITLNTWSHLLLTTELQRLRALSKVTGLGLSRDRIQTQAVLFQHQSLCYMATANFFQMFKCVMLSCTLADLRIHCSVWVTGYHAITL